MSTPKKKLTPTQKIHSLTIIYLTALMQSPGLSEEEYKAAEALSATLAKKL